MRISGNQTTFSHLDNYLDISTSEGAWVRAEFDPEEELKHTVDVRADYQTNEDLCDEFRRDVVTLRFFMFDFNDIVLMRNVLGRIMRCVVDRNEIAWIDTDYGWVISAREFLRKISQEPDWDWRITPEQVAGEH